MPGSSVPSTSAVLACRWATAPVLFLALVLPVFPGGGNEPRAPRGSMNLRFVPGSKTDLTWDHVEEAESYGLYRGTIRPGRDFWREYSCHATEIVGELGRDTATPDPGEAFYYKVGWMKRDPTTHDLVWHDESDDRSRSFAHLSCGERLYVDPSASSSGDGKSWATAYRTIDEAMDHPRTRDRSFEVWVRDAGDASGDVEVPAAGAFLRGGFAGAEEYPWDRSDPGARTRIVGDIEQEPYSGAQAVRIEQVDLAGTISFVACNVAEWRATVLAYDSDLQGIHVEGCTTAEALIHVERCHLDGSVVTTGEGYALDVDVMDSSFDGGGIHAGFSTDLYQVATHLDIRRNEFVGDGSRPVAIELDDTCLGRAGQDYHGAIASNVIRGYDTGIYLSCCACGSGESSQHVECTVDVAVSHNTIVDNHDGVVCNAVLESNGLGQEVVASCKPRVWNNILAYNSGYGFKESSERHESAEDTIDTWTDPEDFVTNDLFRNGCMYLDEGTHELNSTGEVNALDGATNNLSVDPRFVDRTAGDLHLSSTSPLVDRGAVDAPGAGALDMDRERRIMDGDHDGYLWPDVGADEVP